MGTPSFLQGAKCVAFLCDPEEEALTAVRQAYKNVICDVKVAEDNMLQVLLSNGLQMPRALLHEYFGTDLARKKRCDQILRFPIYLENFANRGGTLDFFDGDFGLLFPGREFEACTYQMSDHLPLWVQPNTDMDGRRLDQVIQG